MPRVIRTILGAALIGAAIGVGVAAYRGVTAHAAAEERRRARMTCDVCTAEVGTGHRTAHTHHTSSSSSSGSTVTVTTTTTETKRTVVAGASDAFEALPPLVSCEWLAGKLGVSKRDALSSATRDVRVKVLDASWFLPPPASTRNARREYDSGRIPGAAFFDIDAIATQLTCGGVEMPHMRPSAKVFSAALTELGIGEDDLVVVYDGSGIFNASCRVWWTFMSFGAQGRVAVLDGGLAEWKQQGYPIHTATDLPIASPVRPHAVLRPFPVVDLGHSWMRDLDQMITNCNTRDEIVVDARPGPRFRKEAPEPRASKRLGHIPDAINIPFPTTLCDVPDQKDQKLQKFLSVEALTKLFAAAGLPPPSSKRVITLYCGTGVTGSTLLFAMYLCGYRSLSLYDGSWCQWGNIDDTIHLIV